MTKQDNIDIMTNQEIAQLMKIEELIKEFHEYWKENGEPHPSSNAYLAMNRGFFYIKGLEAADKIRLVGETHD